MSLIMVFDNPKAADEIAMERKIIDARQNTRLFLTHVWLVAETATEVYSKDFNSRLFSEVHDLTHPIQYEGYPLEWDLAEGEIEKYQSN